MRSYNPLAARCQSLGCSLFARHYSGNHVCLLFLQVLRCFSSLGWLSLRSNTPSVCWVVPFGNLRILRLCAAPRSLSQLTTSFIVSKSQGIHHTPLSALKELLLLLDHLQLLLSQYVKELYLTRLRRLKKLMLWLRINRPYANIINYFKNYCGG